MQLAGAAGTSRFHLQRTFRRLVGVSPREYQQALRAERFRANLRRGAHVAEATYDAGYGSSSRVYERRPTGRGVTPAEYQRGARGLDVRYTTMASPFGRLLVAATDKGVCAVRLGDRDDELVAELEREYPLASVRRTDKTLTGWATQIGRAHV